MAKLTNRMPTGATAPDTGAAPQTPVPFQTAPLVVPGKAKRQAKAKEVKAPAGPRKSEWFQQNFEVGNHAKVLSRFRYATRGGFKCGACSIPGSVAFVIELRPDSKVGRPIHDSDGKLLTPNGSMVGETCLKMYGGVDVSKKQPATPPPVSSPAVDVQLQNQ